MSRHALLYLVLLAVLLYASASESLALLLVVIPAASAIWWWTGPGWSKPAPRTVINVLLLGAIVWAVRSIFDDQLLVEDFSEFVILLLLIKLLDRRSPRDDAQVMSLSLFLAIGGILTSNSLLVGLSTLAFALVLAWIAAVHQINTARWRSTSTLDRQNPSRSSATKHLRPMVAVLYAGTFAISVVVFLIMPRGIGANTFGTWGNPGIGSVTGFTDEVELGRGGLISESDTPVLDMVVRDRQGRVIGGPSEVFYLRGAILDTYERGRWTRSEVRKRVDRQQGVWVESTGQITRSDLARIHEITIRNVSGGNAYIFAPWQPRQVRGFGNARFRYNPIDFQFMHQRRRGKLSYEVRAGEPKKLSDSDARTSVPEPFPDKTVESLAFSIVRDVGLDPDPELRSVRDDFNAVKAIESFLRTEYAYTLETLPAPPGEDPTAWFLTESREGHCEYFASALAGMCRAIGVNSRVVTGYVAAEFNTATEHYPVRERNAHAWVEAETLPGLWRTFDPTPSASFDAVHRPLRSEQFSLRQIIEAIEYAWINAVVSFDADRQERVPITLTPVVERAERWADAFYRQSPRSAQRVLSRAIINGLWAFAVSLVATLAVITLLRRRSRKGHAHDPALKFYPRFLRALARRGLAKPVSRTPRAHATMIAQTDTEASDLLRRAADLYYKARFGGIALSQAELREARQLVEALNHRSE